MLNTYGKALLTGYFMTWARPVLDDSVSASLDVKKGKKISLDRDKKIRPTST